jgi:hypothetical protein
VIPPDFVLVLEETVVGSSGLVRNVEGRELVVVKRCIREVAGKTCHHDINENRVGLV